MPVGLVGSNFVVYFSWQLAAAGTLASPSASSGRLVSAGSGGLLVAAVNAVLVAHSC